MIDEEETIDEKYSDRKDRNNDALPDAKTVKMLDSNASALEAYSPLLRMRQEDAEDVSFVIEASPAQRQESEYDLITPSFRGDEEGIWCDIAFSEMFVWSNNWYKVNITGTYLAWT